MDEYKLDPNYPNSNYLERKTNAQRASEPKNDL